MHKYYLIYSEGANHNGGLCGFSAENSLEINIVTISIDDMT